jgi:Tol biopolymer transport system component
MTTHESHVSLSDLESAGVAVNHVAAVSIVRDVVLRASRGELPGIPSAPVIRLNPSGEVSVEGPIAADDWAVRRAAHLLDALLPGFNAQPHLRVPGALRLVVARALGTLDLPPYPSLGAFAEALRRFASPDLKTTVRELVAEFRAAEPTVAQAAPEPTEIEAKDELLDAIGANAAPVRLEPRETSLTISDIRRARRATGVTLAQISERSQISRQLLVELEWGYMRHWPASHVGRTQLVRYARAAGLDDHLVVRTVWPLLEEADRERRTDIPEVSVVPIYAQAPEPTAIAPVLDAIDGETGSTHREWGRKRYLAALAIPALLAIGIAPALWERSATQGSATTQVPGSAATRPTFMPGRPAETGSPVTAPPTPTRSSPSIEAPVPQKEPSKAQEFSTPASNTGRRAQVRAGSPQEEAPLETPALTRASNTTPAAAPVSGIPEGPAYSPSFASVGSAMFYQAASDGKSALMRADTDSRGAVLRITSVVDDRAQNFHARQSPDGTLIAFDSDRDGERGVYIAGADGQNVRRISGDGFAAIPTWSPDGQTIAFVRAEADRPKVWNLWTADVSSGRERRLTSYRVGAPWGGSWFPDGRRIAYSHETNLVVLDIDTGRQRVFDSPIVGRLVRTPAVSPDGKRVMFQVYRDGAWLLEIADGTMRKVLSDPSAEEYTWSPDGQRVAYHSRSDGSWGVWVMAPR